MKLPNSEQVATERIHVNGKQGRHGHVPVRSRGITRRSTGPAGHVVSSSARQWRRAGSRVAKYRQIIFKNVRAVLAAREAQTYPSRASCARAA
jgi:hypothetical protein